MGTNYLCDEANMNIPESSIIKILKNSPSQGTLYILLPVLKDNGEIRLVIQECLKALSRFPDDLTLRKILAEAYLEDDRFLEAEIEFERVIGGIKTLAEAIRSQADIYLLQKREDDARESLRHFLSFFPENQEAVELLRELDATIDISPAESLEEHEDSDITDNQEQTDFPEIITASLAETFFNQGRLNEAREIYEKLVEKNPEDEAARLRLDEILVLMDQENKPVDLTDKDKIRKRKERMISILDSWRNNIRSFAKEGLTAE